MDSVMFSFIASLVLVFVSNVTPLAFQNVEQMTDYYLNADDLRDWNPPLWIQLNCSYYLSGYDAERRPIWVAEFGTWDVRSIIEAGQSELLEKYIDQFTANVMHSLRSEEPNGTLRTTVAIADLRDYPLRQMTSVPTATFTIAMFRKFEPFLREYLEHGVAVNMNFVAQNMLTLIRPVLGEVIERVEFYGSNKNAWLPKIASKFPKNQIPEWYGGTKGYKPLKFYGR